MIEAEEPVNHTENDLEMVGLQCLADIRAAVGDSGQMMQSELVAHVAGLAKDAARYRWAVKSVDNAYRFARLVATYSPNMDDVNSSVDAARAKEAK